MKKKFKIEGLLCANCGNKIESEIKNLSGVNDANISFLTEKVKLDLDDDANVEEILAQANKIADKIEPGSRIIAG